ncbi:hypothetical protein [Gordonia sp. N1V]|uniref:hypothetical protein n=1 Tax=Gordonia sp. N1V TaxID=3034163 RepID=UPI0023E1493D|nr:hypothetical protein [Gordonia sp. N1V]MDF3284984.1 hypothetical protein [Gordonia sp. N1V]
MMTDRKRLVPKDYENYDGVQNELRHGDFFHPNTPVFEQVVRECGLLASVEEAARDLAWDTFRRWDDDGRPVLEDEGLYEAYCNLEDALAVKRNPAPADAFERRRAMVQPPTEAEALDAVAVLAQAGRYYSKGRHHDRLVFALATSERLTAQSDEMLLNAVIAARKDGRSWEYIGEALGLARQNAYRRFAHRIPPTPQEIADQLNAYQTSHSADGSDGPVDNIWQDLIYGLDAYDPEATEAADPDSRSDVVVLTDGSTIRWDQQAGQWYVD